MLTFNIDYKVLPDRLVTIKLPETVRVADMKKRYARNGIDYALLARQ